MSTVSHTLDRLMDQGKVVERKHRKIRIRMPDNPQSRNYVSILLVSDANEASRTSNTPVARLRLRLSRNRIRGSGTARIICVRHA